MNLLLQEGLTALPILRYHVRVSSRCGEMADALDSKSSVVPYVPVRVRPSAPLVNSRLYGKPVKPFLLSKFEYINF